MKGGPKRCLLLRSFSQESSKIYSISMEGKRLRAPVSMFRPGSSTSDFYKVIKIFIEADSNQNVHLSGPHIADESDYKRSRNSQGYVYFFYCRVYSPEICSGALVKDRVSRSENRLGENDINTTTGKSKKN